MAITGDLHPSLPRCYFRSVQGGNVVGARLTDQSVASPTPMAPTKMRVASTYGNWWLPGLHMYEGEWEGSFGSIEAVATILIIGASRGIGLETVKAALRAGHSVRALARSARRIPVDHSNLEKMPGDALQMATVRRALTGVDVVIQSLGLSAGPEVIFKPTGLFSTAMRVLVTAMEKAQVKRLICVTGFGAGDSRGRGGFLYSTAFVPSAVGAHL